MQRVELTRPETGGANGANCRGPAMGRRSEVHEGKLLGPEARASTSRWRLEVHTLFGWGLLDLNQVRTRQKRDGNGKGRKETDIFWILQTQPGARGKKLVCPTRRGVKEGVATARRGAGKVPRRPYSERSIQNCHFSKSGGITLVMLRDESKTAAPLFALPHCP